MDVSGSCKGVVFVIAVVVYLYKRITPSRLDRGVGGWRCLGLGAGDEHMKGKVLELGRLGDLVSLNERQLNSIPGTAGARVKVHDEFGLVRVLGTRPKTHIGQSNTDGRSRAITNVANTAN